MDGLFGIWDSQTSCVWETRLFHIVDLNQVTPGDIFLHWGDVIGLQVQNMPDVVSMPGHFESRAFALFSRADHMTNRMSPEQSAARVLLLVAAGPG